MSRRKREEAMIYQQAVANALKNEENDEAKRYHRAQLEETKRHNIVEEETKDRVDISKKEYKEDISLKSLSEKLGYEEHYISRCFNRYFDRNFKSFINELRISFAIEYMNQNPDSTITQIALSSGFQSVRSFNRAYKNVVGTTPKHSK